MPGQENYYNLGLKGVNVDKSPIHKDDGELLDAQNGQVDSVGAMGGLRTRDGMARLNGSVLAGSPRGIIGLPLPDLDTTHSATLRHFYAAVDDNGFPVSHNFRTSTDGTTWGTTDAGLVRPAQRANFVSSTLKAMSDLLVWGVLNQKFYYAGNDYTPGTTNPTIHVWDGATDSLITSIPKNAYSTTASPGILSIVPFDKTKLLVTTYDDNTGLGRGRMFTLDVTNGALKQLGRSSDQQNGVCVMPIVFQGKIFWLGYNNGGGAAVKTYWTRPELSDWFEHLASATGNTATGYIRGAAVFLGELYFGSMADAGASARIRKVSQASVYTTARTSASTTQFNTEGPLIVSADGLTLYVYEDLHDVTTSVTHTAAKQVILKTTDGAIFSTEFDVGGRLNNAHWRSGTPLRDKNGDIYWPFCEDNGSTGKILKRTSAGVWSVADGADNHLSDGNSMRGQLAAIRF